MAGKNREWEDWKREQVEAVPRRARRRMRELLDSVPGPPKAWAGGIRRLREAFRRMARGKRGKE